MVGNRGETLDEAVVRHRPLCCMRRGTTVQVAVPRRMTNGFWHVDVKCGRCVSAAVETARYKEFAIGDSVYFGASMQWGRLVQIHGERGTSRRWLIAQIHGETDTRKYSYRSNGRWHRVGTTKNDTDIAWVGHTWDRTHV